MNIENVIYTHNGVSLSYKNNEIMTLIGKWRSKL
jgi:hypothetical protein